MKCSLTVIIPVYNAEQYLKGCLDSVEQQTYQDYEVILVDDGSTDGSRAICDNYAARNRSWRTVHKKNGGALTARRAGLQVAQGDYIAFIDADDWVERDFLKTFMNHAEFSGADMVLGGCVKTWQGISQRQWNRLPEGVYEGEALAAFYKKMLCYQEFFTFGVLPYMWNKLFRKDILVSVINEVDIRVYDGEDVVVNMLCMLKAKKLELIEDFSYHYVLRESSVTVKKKQDYYANVSRLYLCLYETFCKSEHSEFLLPQLDAYMRMMIRQSAPEKFVKQEKYRFPFEDVRSGAKIVLYAAGNVGRIFYGQMKSTVYCNILAWVDKDYQSEEMQRMGVQSPDVLGLLEYEQVVLAVESEKLAERIKKELLQYGIPEEKLIWRNYVLNEADDLQENR